LEVDPGRKPPELAVWKYPTLLKVVGAGFVQAEQAESAAQATLGLQGYRGEEELPSSASADEYFGK
jgi:hypothetical protein